MPVSTWQSDPDTQAARMLLSLLLLPGLCFSVRNEIQLCVPVCNLNVITTTIPWLHLLLYSSLAVSEILNNSDNFALSFVRNTVGLLILMISGDVIFFESNPGFCGRNLVVKTTPPRNHCIKHDRNLDFKPLPSYNASVAEWFNDQISTAESRVRLQEIKISRFHHVLRKLCPAFTCLWQLLRKGMRVFTHTLRLVTIVEETVVTEIFFVAPGRKYRFSNWLLCGGEL